MLTKVSSDPGKGKLVSVSRGVSALFSQRQTWPPWWSPTVERPIPEAGLSPASRRRALIPTGEPSRDKEGRPQIQGDRCPPVRKPGCDEVRLVLRRPPAPQRHKLRRKRAGRHVRRSQPSVTDWMSVSPQIPTLKPCPPLPHQRDGIRRWVFVK